MGVTEEQYEALLEAFSEWLRAQAADVLRIARRILGERDDSAQERLLEALNEYYTDLAKHVPDQLRDAIQPIAEDAFAQVREQVGCEIAGLDAGWIEGYMSRYCEQMGKRQANANRRSVERIVRRGGDVLDNLEKKLASWPAATAEQRAMTEAAFARSEAFVAAARKAGYNSVWKSNPACCAACRELDGQVLRGDFRPPLHAGCSCSVALGQGFSVEDLTVELPKSIIIPDSQFGTKASQHMRDWGLDVKNENDRETFGNIIGGIVGHPDEIRSVQWRSQGVPTKDGVDREEGPVYSYIKGEDVVLLNPVGEFITIMRGGKNNRRVKGGRQVNNG